MGEIGRKRLATIVVVLAILGAGLSSCLTSIERGMIYHPTSETAAPDPAGPPIQVVRIRTADGETLTGWWLAPVSETAPVILFFNGNADSPVFGTARWQRIAAQGAGFLTISYRGYDGSSGHPSETGLRQDALAAYGWLAQRVPPSRIVIHGHSLGSAVAARLASEKPARALILESPFTAAADIAKQVLPWAPVGLLMHDKFLTREVIGKVKAPLLIVHGDRDDVIPFRHGAALFDLANQPKTFVRMIGSGHNSLPVEGLYDHVWRFLNVPFEGSTAEPGAGARFEVTSPTTGP